MKKFAASIVAAAILAITATAGAVNTQDIAQTSPPIVPVVEIAQTSPPIVPAPSDDEIAQTSPPIVPAIYV